MLFQESQKFPKGSATSAIMGTNVQNLEGADHGGDIASLEGHRGSGTSALWSLHGSEKVPSSVPEKIPAETGAGRKFANGWKLRS